MANRIRTKIHGNTGKLQDTNGPSKLLSSARSSSTEKQDEIITSLADRYENKRARQVGEWERLYGQNVYRAY